MMQTIFIIYDDRGHCSRYDNDFKLNQQLKNLTREKFGGVRSVMRIKLLIMHKLWDMIAHW